jgi:hypothetical protein
LWRVQGGVRRLAWAAHCDQQVQASVQSEIIWQGLHVPKLHREISSGYANPKLLL